jgi:hypothetical protein
MTGSPKFLEFNDFWVSVSLFFLKEGQLKFPDVELSKMVAIGSPLKEK